MCSTRTSPMASCAKSILCPDLQRRKKANRCAAGTATESDYMIAGIPYAPEMNYAVRGVLSNPAVFGQPIDKVVELINQAAGKLHKGALESQGIPTIQDKRNFKNIMDALRR